MSERCETCHRPFTKGRSNQQGRYYFGVVVKAISEHTGFTTDETHEILKSKFLPTMKTFNDMVFKVSRSTTSLTTKQMEEFLSQVRIWASSDLQVFIPEPNESEIE